MQKTATRTGGTLPLRPLGEGELDCLGEAVKKVQYEIQLLAYIRIRK